MGAPIVLVAELRVRDRAKLLRYASAVQPVIATHGGRIVATSASGARTVEGDGPDGVLVVHEWETESGFDGGTPRSTSRSSISDVRPATPGSTCSAACSRGAGPASIGLNARWPVVRRG